MNSDRLARLTEQQRICLRLVFAHMTSKEIAPLLGIEPNSVDQHIKAAMRVLGVADRRAAARLLAEHEGATSARPLVYQSPDVAPPSEITTFAKSTESWRPQQGGAMREQQSTFERMPLLPEGKLPLPLRDSAPGNLNWLRRLMWIIVIMLAIAFVFGMFLAGLESLSRMTRH